AAVDDELVLGHAMAPDAAPPGRARAGSDRPGPGAGDARPDVSAAHDPALRRRPRPGARGARARHRRGGRGAEGGERRRDRESIRAGRDRDGGLPPLVSVLHEEGRAGGARRRGGGAIVEPVILSEATKDPFTEGLSLLNGALIFPGTPLAPPGLRRKECAM